MWFKQELLERLLRVYESIQEDDKIATVEHWADARDLCDFSSAVVGPVHSLSAWFLEVCAQRNSPYDPASDRTKYECSLHQFVLSYGRQ